MGEQPRGFWFSAAEEPERVAVIDADGREWYAGEILGDAYRLVHVLRARGLEAGDAVATMLPNRAELIEILLAVFQAGWNYVPLNSNLTVSEVAYILGDSGARALIADERYAEVAAAAADEAGLPA